MQSKAKTVADYLAALPADRREALAAVRTVILANLDPGFEEVMQYGMIGYAVPHRLYPAGYHCDPEQPLPFAGLAAQKNHLALYLMGVYMLPEEAERLRTEWRASGRKLDMGSSCVRFKRLADVPLDVLAAAIRRLTVARYVEAYERALASMAKASKGTTKARAKKAPAKKTPAKKTPAKKAPAKKAAARKAPAAARRTKAAPRRR